MATTYLDDALVEFGDGRNQYGLSCSLGLSASLAQKATAVGMVRNQNQGSTGTLPALASSE